jgi:hypothetical protein
MATLPVTAGASLGLGYPVTSIISEAFGYRAAFWFGALAVALALVVTPGAAGLSGGAARCRAGVLLGGLLLAVVAGIMPRLRSPTGRNPSRPAGFRAGRPATSKGPAMTNHRSLARRGSAAAFGARALIAVNPRWLGGTVRR